MLDKNKVLKDTILDDAEEFNRFQVARFDNYLCTTKSAHES